MGGCAVLMQRLRELDRKVLREDRRRTPEQWRRQTGRWWWLLAISAALVLVNLGTSLALDNGPVPVVAAVPTSLVLAYQAGRMRSEHDRVLGRDPYARIRPRTD